MVRGLDTFCEYFRDYTDNYIIVVSHNVPSFQLSSPDFAGSPVNGAFTVELEEYIKASPISYWIYSHSHRNKG